MVDLLIYRGPCHFSSPETIARLEQEIRGHGFPAAKEGSFLAKLHAKASTMLQLGDFSRVYPGGTLNPEDFRNKKFFLLRIIDAELEQVQCFIGPLKDSNGDLLKRSRYRIRVEDLSLDIKRSINNDGYVLANRNQVLNYLEDKNNG